MLSICVLASGHMPVHKAGVLSHACLSLSKMLVSAYIPQATDFAVNNLTLLRAYV